MAYTSWRDASWQCLERRNSRVLEVDLVDIEQMVVHFNGPLDFFFGPIALQLQFLAAASRSIWYDEYFAGREGITALCVSARRATIE
jgi:hypothetical protein